MACIYIIENRINGKKYIGATKTSLSERFRKHIYTAHRVKSRHYENPLYQDMRKYGVEKFKVSVLEECSEKELPMLERHFIEKFDTINNGYNIALGGKGKPLWDSQTIEEWKRLYEQGTLLKDIAEQYKTHPKTVGNKLRENFGIDTKENSNLSFGIKVVGISDSETVSFVSQSDAGRYIKEKKGLNGNVVGIIRKIGAVRDNPKRTAYGYKWISE